MESPRERSSATDEPTRIAISGSSGLVGRAASAVLGEREYQIDRIVRTTTDPRSGRIFWDPAREVVDREALEGVDAVVHLAGENIAKGRWTPARKEAIRSSRVRGTGLLCRTLGELRTPPRVIVVASAVGYYGDRGNELVTEDSPPGSGFLAQVCREWEDAAQPARDAGIRVVHLRIGVVLSSNGGVLARMLPVFKLGLGGRLGNGRQYMSWIALPDLVEVIHHVLASDNLNGPINAVSPNPVTNKEFTATLGRILRRPTVLAVPASILRMGLGQMGDDLLLAGTRADPTRLGEAGFRFEYPLLADALRHELGLGVSACTGSARA